MHPSLKITCELPSLQQETGCTETIKKEQVTHSNSRSAATVLQVYSFGVVI